MQQDRLDGKGQAPETCTKSKFSKFTNIHIFVLFHNIDADTELILATTIPLAILVICSFVLVLVLARRRCTKEMNLAKQDVNQDYGKYYSSGDFHAIM